MAVSAALEENRGVNESGNRRSVIALVSYVAEVHSNGYSLPKEIFGYKTHIESVLFLNADVSGTDFYKWDRANQTVRKFAEGAAVYVEVTSNLTEDIRIQVEGH